MAVERAQKSEVHETTDDATSGGAEEDRPKLSPERAGSEARGEADETRISSDPDESSFGGPLKIEDPTTAEERNGGRA